MAKSSASKSASSAKKIVLNATPRVSKPRYLSELPTELQQQFWKAVLDMLVATKHASARRSQQAIADYRRELGAAALFAFHKGAKNTAEVLFRRLTSKQSA